MLSAWLIFLSLAAFLPCAKAKVLPWSIKQFYDEVQFPSVCIANEELFDRVWLTNINCTRELELLDVQELADFFRFVVEVKDFHPLTPRSELWLQKVQTLFRSLSQAPVSWSLGTVIRLVSKGAGIDLFERCSLELREYPQFHLFMDYLQRACSFMHALYENVELQRQQTAEASHIRALVIGGGPVGLMSAIESYASGAQVEVVEKRKDYTRNTWFDLESPPVSASL
eukprot:TRINITY_DN9241_c0_g1_i1.p1 TRINITY_DN9241_c0_g1~~TRINITY_DN9241_c0_g1_i1.p1  ORF type:complete len:227 (-),score=23.02 TRINITY_DN9241_c0_g1_i1:98-778(-)